jgi:hypothetical protein
MLWSNLIKLLKKNGHKISKIPLQKAKDGKNNNLNYNRIEYIIKL